jgi:hypothetical protein
MRIWLPVATLLSVLQTVPALADRDPLSGAPLPPGKKAVASPITDRFYIRATLFDPAFRTSVRLDPSDMPGVKGTPVNAERELGLPARDQTGTVEFMFRLRQRSKLRINYYETDRSGSQVLANNVVFGNETFAAGQLAQTSLDFRMFDLTYTYSFVRTEHLEIGTGVAAYFLQVQAQGSVPALFQYQSVSAADPFPAIPLDLTWVLSQRFAFVARGAYMKITLNGFHGSLEDMHSDLQYRWSPHFAVGAGYSVVRLSVSGTTTDSFPGYFALNVSGPEAFVRFSF